MFARITQSLKLALASKTGVSSGLIVFAVIAALSAIMAFVFACVVAFIWLSQRFTTFEAAGILAGSFLALAVVTAIAALVIRQRNMHRASLALRAQASALLAEPRVMAAGYQIGRALGWKTVLPVALVALAIFGVARGRSASE